LCAQCPLKALCKSSADGTMLDYPAAKKPKEKRNEKRTVYVLAYHGKIAIRQRQAKGLLASLYEFPSEAGKLTEKEALESLGKQGFRVRSLKNIGETKHVFSHLMWDIQGYEAELDAPSSLAGVLWVGKKEMLTQYPIPSAFAYFKKKIFEE
jgi:A/G-specific adenine glycosylase